MGENSEKGGGAEETTGRTPDQIVQETRGGTRAGVGFNLAGSKSLRKKKGGGVKSWGSPLQRILKSLSGLGGKEGGE